MNDFVWTARVRADAGRSVVVHARNHAFTVGEPLTFRPSDAHPSALEFALGALAADVLGTFRKMLNRRRIHIDALEASVTAALHNPLVFEGVIGEEGSPGIRSVELTVYVASDAEPDALESVWEESLQRSPLYQTLAGCIHLQTRLCATP